MILYEFDACTWYFYKYEYTISENSLINYMCFPKEDYLSTKWCFDMQRKNILRIHDNYETVAVRTEVFV